jgi:predicted nucleic acid-binding protein
MDRMRISLHLPSRLYRNWSSPPSACTKSSSVCFQQRGEDEALQAVAVMAQGRVVDLTMTLAMNAARLSVDLRLPMADSIILATAHAYHAILWTQDADFRGREGVQYIERRA